MKYLTGFIFILAVTIFGAWFFMRTGNPLALSYSSGQVEKEIHGFGASLDSALDRDAMFDKTTSGFEAKPQPPQTPVGLKPQELQAWTAFALHQGVEPALVPIFPANYASGTSVRSQGMTVALTPRRSNEATAQIENGKLVYHNIYASTDSMNVVSEGRSEEFLLLHDAQAPQRFEYDLTTMAGVKEMTLADNAISFTNADGKKMQIEAPWLVESGGKKVANAVRWELSYPNGDAHPRLALVVADASKLHYPVVIDPTWVVTNSGLVTARDFHTATLLNNGMVLVAGGEGNSGYLLSAELYHPATGTWATTGSLHAAHASATATLLQNGMVLLAGGYIGSYETAAELYDPVAGTWKVAGSMNTAREFHTATLLPNGTVLVAGGLTTGPTALASSEIYTYSSSGGSWALTTGTNGSMSSARLSHTATLLQNGTVLVAGGTDNVNAYYNTSEIYNNGAWSPTVGNLVSKRFLHTATLLANGTVLVAGGSNGSTVLATAEIYSPVTGRWTATANNLTTARQSHTASLLPNGNVVVAGGYSGGMGIVPSVEIFTPGVQTWAAAPGNLQNARENHTSTILPSGQVLVVGGFNGSYLASSELYDPASGSWAYTTGGLNQARFEHTATLLPNGQVLVAGGQDNAFNALATSELYNPANGAWTYTTGHLQTARYDHTATLLPNGNVLVAGGFANNTPLASAEIYNSGSKTWTLTGSLNVGRNFHAATLLPDGEVLVAGGNSKSGVTKTAELYNVASGTWTLTGNLNATREEFTATLLLNGQVLAAGGAGSAGGSSEVYNPITGSWTATTGMLKNPRYQHTATLLPNGNVLLAGGFFGSSVLESAEIYNPTMQSWTLTANMNNSRRFHTATLLTNGKVMVAGGDSSTGGTVELYDPASGIWTTTGSLNTGRNSHTATLLASGKVLVAGGLDTDPNQPLLASSELYDPGLGYSTFTQPVLSAVTGEGSTLFPTLSGSGFTAVQATATGGVEGSGGGTNNSASNLPVVVMQSLVNEQVQVLTLNSSLGFSATTYNALQPTNFVPGYVLLTMFVNGTPSVSQITTYSESTQTIAGFNSSQTVSLGTTSVTFPQKTSDNQTITYIVVSGPAVISGDTVTFTGTGTVVVQANAPGSGAYAPLATYDTITVPAPPATDTPTMPVWALMLLGGALLLVAGREVSRGGEGRGNF